MEDAILLGAPVDGSEKAWERMTRVVAGKIVNGYCRSSGAAVPALLWLNNNNCRKHWSIDCLLWTLHQSEGTGSWDSCTEVQPPSCLLPGYSQSMFRIDESSTWISPPWWVTKRQGLLKVPRVWLSHAVWRAFFFSPQNMKRPLCGYIYSSSSDRTQWC